MSGYFDPPDAPRRERAPFHDVLDAISGTVKSVQLKNRFTLPMMIFSDKRK